jgi:hypothetical protein
VNTPFAPRAPPRWRKIRTVWMLKFIGLILAAIPFFIAAKTLLGLPSMKRSQALTEFKKQMNFAVSAILFCICCAVVYAIGKVLYQFMP